MLDTYKSSVPIAWYLTAAATVSVVAVLVARETKGVDLAAIDAADTHGLGMFPTGMDAELVKDVA